MKDDQESLCSTVTSLFLNDKTQQRNHVHALERTPTKPPNNWRKSSFSASKILDRYIHNYEKSQTLKLAQSMTEVCTKTPINRECMLSKSKKSPSLLDNEIRMAQRLLQESSVGMPDDLPRDGPLTIDDLLLEEPPSIVGVTSSDSVSESFGKSTRCSRTRRRKLDFTSSDDSSDDASAAPTCGSYGSAATSSDDEAGNLESQVEDLRRTWRLVEDLKADASSSRKTINGHQMPPEKQLHDLIRRLSAAAMRKEEKLRHNLTNTSSSRHSHLDSIRKRLDLVLNPRPLHLSPHNNAGLLDYSSHSATEPSSCDVTSLHGFDAALRHRGNSRSSWETSSADSSSSGATTDHSSTDAVSARGQSQSDTSSSRLSLPFKMEGRSRDVREFMDDCFAKSRGGAGRHPPGEGVEALKDMISSLQHLTADQPYDVRSERDDIGTDSFRRAMTHLENLKKIVASQ